MKRFFFLVSTLLLLFTCGKNNENPQEQIKSGDPVVTAEATDVTMNSAILYGYVNTEYLLKGGESGFIVSTSSTPSLDNGHNGWLVTYLVNNNSIFLPAAGVRYEDYSPGDVGDGGYYWSSSLDTDYPRNAWRLTFGSDNVIRSFYRRNYGLSIRPVSE